MSSVTGGSSVKGVESRLQSTWPSYNGTGVLPVDNWSPICTCIFIHTELLDVLVADTSRQVPFSILCTTVLCNHHILVQGWCAGCQRSWSQRGPGLGPLVGRGAPFYSTLTPTTYMPMMYATEQGDQLRAECKPILGPRRTALIPHPAEGGSAGLRPKGTAHSAAGPLPTQGHESGWP